MEFTIPDLGEVLVSFHAQERMEAEGISEGLLYEVLENGREMNEGYHILWKDWKGIRAIVLLHSHVKGKKMVKTVFRIMPQARVRK